MKKTTVQKFHFSPFLMFLTFQNMQSNMQKTDFVNQYFFILY